MNYRHVSVVEITTYLETLFLIAIKIANTKNAPGGSIAIKNPW